MEKIDVVRAWKDPLYRARLSREEIHGLPLHPAGLLEVDEEQLRSISGGLMNTTFKTCTVYTVHSHGCCP